MAVAAGGLPGDDGAQSGCAVAVAGVVDLFVQDVQGGQYLLAVYEQQ